MLGYAYNAPLFQHHIYTLSGTMPVYPVHPIQQTILKLSRKTTCSPDAENACQPLHLTADRACWDDRLCLFSLSRTPPNEYLPALTDAVVPHLDEYQIHLLLY